ncbi:putative d-3-phosphoglycerate dehydrogenase protein [Lasiodiplodia theobromae]|uniref:D-3-phosphoglycerate dehydrogenase protein n=1 Tax=Lasiodiplodia theobromae TaxID=45133 RepID=A0A8H7IS43_9PEZI|nr:putative d-3-phosphoglycerate dehydrogenase protein [Lasiodiplodia theobromae]
MAPASVADLEPSTPSTTNKPTVYVLDKFHPDAIAHARTLFNVILNTDPAFPSSWHDAEYLLIRSSWLRAADIAACPNLKAIGKHGVGTDKIDARACAARNIAVLNTPGANARAVAELVLALTMAVAREVCSIDRRQQAGAVVPKEACRGLTLHGRTLGVVGMGNIGRVVARMFHRAFDAPVVAYDPFMPAAGALPGWDFPYRRAATVGEVVREADVLTLHVPLTEETRDLLAYEELCTMKPEAILINAARGGIVNERDLERVLREGRIWGAGLDCHEQEPPTKERYAALWELPNVVSTPHIGAATAEAQRTAAMAAVDNLYRHIVGLEK